MNTIPKLSFCITCKNRLHQIKDTLAKNLLDNQLFKEQIEFVLVDFGSKDGLKQWVLSSFENELKEGYLAYYYTDELPDWHASIAKNTAHLLASNEILVNLDCDNFTGENGGSFVIKNFLKYGLDIAHHQFRGKIGDGTFGRIAILNTFFSKLGGYDESFEPMGYQDIDLLLRAGAIGLKYKRLSNAKYSYSIKNTKAEGISNCNSKLSYNQMNLLNRDKSKENLKSGKLVSNNGLFGIRKNLFNYNGEEIK